MNIGSSLLTLRHEVGRQLGLKGAIGVALLLVTLCVLLLVTPHLQKDAALTRLQIRSQLRAFNHDRLAQRTAPASGEQIAQFNAWFPTIGQNAGDLRRILDEAGKARLQINKGDYKISSDPGMTFVKYEVVLPVKASYNAIRGFVAGVLNALPHASLAELHMERPAANSAMLDARIHFTLFYRGA